MANFAGPQLHYAHSESRPGYTPCGLWPEYVVVTVDPDRVTCPTCRAEIAVPADRKPLVSPETIAEVAAMEERDPKAGGFPWDVPDHPDHDLPGGWHRGQIPVVDRG